MEVTEKTVEQLDGFLKEHQEADVIAILAQRKNLSSNEALELYFSSRIPGLISEGTCGFHYLSPEYLADEVLKELGL